MTQKGTVHNVDGALMIKDIDTVEGVITGYFSVFGNVDSDQDMIMPGAFNRTIREQGHRIKHLWQHDHTKPIAAPKVFEDSYGLVFESKISRTSLGRDVLQLYIDGVISEHSIGYKVVKKQSKSSYTELHDLDLWEGSSVTFASNPLALTTGIKGMPPTVRTEKMKAVERALDRGRYENEEIFQSLEVCYKHFKGYTEDFDHEEVLAHLKRQGSLLDAQLKADRAERERRESYERLIQLVKESNL